MSASRRGDPNVVFAFGEWSGHCATLQVKVQRLSFARLCFYIADRRFGDAINYQRNIVGAGLQSCVTIVTICIGVHLSNLARLASLDSDLGALQRLTFGVFHDPIQGRDCLGLHFER